MLSLLRREWVFQKIESSFFKEKLLEKEASRARLKASNPAVSRGYPHRRFEITP
jgi:hypothetical protein